MSSRLSEKLIRKIHGREIIVWVAQRIATLGAEFIIAIDDLKVGEILRNHQLPFILTDKDHISGTSRLSQVAEVMPDIDFYCSAQGDEPLINSSEVAKFIEQGEEFAVDYLNAVCKFSTLEDPSDAFIVKAVISSTGRLIYASRVKVPFSLSTKKSEYLQICGLYLFSKEFILRYKYLPQSKFEALEGIEHLRCLDLGIAIQTLEIGGEMLSVDTYEDLEKISNILRDDLTMGVIEFRQFF